jgi:hypothetical protein
MASLPVSAPRKLSPELSSLELSMGHAGSQLYSLASFWIEVHHVDE